MFLKELNGIAEKEKKPHIFHRDGFVLLTDDCKCRLARIENISILEAFRNATLVHFAEENFLIRRSLVECERRLDTSIFFRASRDCIVNLSQVKQARLLQDGGLIFRVLATSNRKPPLSKLARDILPFWRCGA